MKSLDELLQSYGPAPRACQVCASGDEVQQLVAEFVRRYRANDVALAGWSLTGNKPASRSLFRILVDRFGAKYSKHRLSNHIRYCLKDDES